MDEQIQDIQLGLLKTQTEKYKREISVLKENNERLQAKINTANRRANEIKILNGIRDDIAELRKEVSAIYELVRDRGQGSALPAQDHHAPDFPDGRNITFRDLQKASRQAGRADTKFGTPKFVSYHKVRETPKKKPAEKEVNDDKASFSFFRWKF